MADLSDAPGRPWPRISVLVPTYNQAGFLEEAVASVLAQDYPDLEIVISDDASSDTTPEVTARLARDPRVKSYRNAHNLGRVANYRHLLEDLATGEWVLVLDGDDQLVGTTYLRAAMTRASSDPAIVLVFAKALSGATLAEATTVLNAPGSVAGGVPPVIDGNAFFLRFPPFETIVPLHATCLYHRASALEIGFYTHDILSSDFESFYRLMLDHKVGFVDEVAALWRQHGGNATRSRDVDAARRNGAVFDGPFRRAVALKTFPDGVAERWLRRCRARYLVSLGAQAVRQRLPVLQVLRLAGNLVRQDWRLAVDLVPAIWRAASDARRRKTKSIGR